MGEFVTTLVTKEEIDAKLDELAKQITSDYMGKPVHFVCLLKGAVIFMVDLARKVELDVTFDFMDVSSYFSGTESTGVVKIDKDLDMPIEGKNVILIDDIVDSGRTLEHIIAHLRLHNPASLKVCTLLNKPERREVASFTIDYNGIVIPNEFVVGYGLDYNQKYRNLPYIGVLHFDSE